MSEVIVFVDDLLPDNPHYVTEDICNAMSIISRKKQRDIKTRVISGEDMRIVRIANALPVLKAAINDSVDLYNDTLIGICIDLVDRRTIDTQENIFDGEHLLEAIKQDEETQHFDVVVYTGKHIPVDEQRLKQKGAKGLVRREVTRGTEKTYELMAVKILDLLGP